MSLVAHKGRCPRCGNDPQADAEFRAAVLAAHGPTVPPVEDLLVMAVESGIIGMSKVMDPNLQDALTAFAKRLAAASSATPA